MRLDRLGRDVELLRDPAIRTSFRDQGEHLQLAAGELRQAGQRPLLAQCAPRRFGGGLQRLVVEGNAAAETGEQIGKQRPTKARPEHTE